MASEEPTKVDGEDDGRADHLAATYAVIAARRAGYDSLMWQVPSLGLTAQAFLLTIALGPGTAQVPRLAASLLAGIVALLSMQLMSKHRLHEQIDSIELERIEHDMGVTKALGFAPHERSGSRVSRHGLAVNRWTQISSYRAWMFGLGTFAIVAFGAFAAALLGLQIFT